MLFQTDLLLVYGPSGVGKTSLLRCGLASRFETHDWLELSIRRWGNINVSTMRVLSDALVGEPIELSDELANTSPQPSDGVPGASTQMVGLALGRVYLRYFKPIYLIFDQFEELYVLGDEQEQVEFIAVVRQILSAKHPVKVILSVREEYLGHLFDFERAVPELLRKRYRVEPMTRSQVKDVVKRMGNAKESLVSIKGQEENAIAESILDRISIESDADALSLPYLQVFLDKVYLHITHDKSRQARAILSLSQLASMGNIDDVLRDFLDDQALKISRHLSCPSEKVWKAVSSFATLDGTKEPLSLGSLIAQWSGESEQLLGQIVQQLVEGRILRYLKPDDQYEIAHDSLAAKIHERRSDEEITILELRRMVRSQAKLSVDGAFYLSAQQLRLIEPYLQSLGLDRYELAWVEKSQAVLDQREAEESLRKAESLRRTKRRLRVAVSALIFVIALLVFAIWQFSTSIFRPLTKSAYTANVGRFLRFS